MSTKERIIEECYRLIPTYFCNCINHETLTPLCKLLQEHDPNKFLEHFEHGKRYVGEALDHKMTLFKIK